MAQYFDDFSANEIDTAPAGWTTRVGSLGLLVVEDPAASGGKALKIGPGSSQVSHSFVSLDAVDDDADRADFEVLIRSNASATHSTGQNLCGAAGRAFSTGGMNGYACGRRFTGWRDRIVGAISGGSTTVLATTAGTTVASSVYCYGRFRVQGESLKYRSWGGTLEDEPTAWNIETTNTTHGAAGWIGVWRNLLTGDVYVDFVGVGTGGDPAPSGPVGGGSYTETLDTLITSISNAADRQAYRETVDTLIESGATVAAVTGMVEALLSLGVSASTAADVQGYADGVSDTIVSASDTDDAQDYVDGPATTGVSASDETDTQAYTDSLADSLVSASNVTDTTGAPPLAESLLTTAVSASNVSAAQAYVDTVTALAVSASSLDEVLGLVEQLGTVAESISAVSDRQLYFDNVPIVALSSSSLAEVGAYIEQVSAAAVSASSLTDVLVGSFVGRYVFADYCRPRSFADYARPRSFEDYCRPRGRRLQ